MRKTHEKNISAYNKKADDYNNTFDGVFTEKFKKFLLSVVDVKDGDAVLDVACGNGTLLSRFSREINGYGADISPQMIKNASANFPQFKFAVAGCEKIPFDDASMDVITVCSSYHHFPDVNAFAAEAKRLLKPLGSLYIAEIFLPPVIRHIANIFVPLSKDGDVKIYSKKEIAKTFSSFEFISARKKGHMQIIHLQRGR